MDLPSAKEIKRLADACRKAGIRSFKGGGIEFELKDDAPQSDYKKAKAAKRPFEDDTQPETEELSPDALLFWSVGGVGTESTKSE